ncbi:kinase-like domain, phloem protein 2-like protein, partial [Tanacetum coccineum]
GSVSHSTSRCVESISRKKTVSSFKYLSHSQLSFEDIESATTNFAPENIIREKPPVKWVYQGRMLHSGQFIDIVARGIYSEYPKDECKKFRMEKSMLSSLNHTNLVSVIFGFSDNSMITVYKKEAKGSLNKYLSDQTLTWMLRLKICLGVANALSYIHYDAGRDFSVIHCNIRSSKILLDDGWEPKLSGFELSLRNTVARRLLLTRDIIENVYLDPKYKKIGGVTHKSDVYSLGVVLFEVLRGKSAVLPDEALGQGLLSPLANSHLDDMIDQHLRNQMDQEALEIFSETAYCCIKEERADRPYIDQVVKGLEKALKLQLMYENPELQRNAVDNTSSNHLRWQNLEHLKIGHNDIEMATEKFADKYCIGSGGYSMSFDNLIADFGLSKFHPVDQDASTFNASTIAGTPMYFDPEYEKSGKLNKKSDIYSFGVVLFEILTGRLAYDFDKGIAPIARHHFEKGILMEIVDHKIKEETNEHVFSLSKGPNEGSLDTFSKIAIRCLAVTQVERPSIDVVINELKKALYFQENHKDNLKLSLQDIKLVTQSFGQDNIIGHGDFGNVYKGHTHGHNIVAAKRLDRKTADGEAEFMTELEILMEYKHENVIGLVGYCDEED